MKHPTMSQWYVSMWQRCDNVRDNVSTGQNDCVPSVRLHNVSNKPQMKHPVGNTQRRLSRTPPRRLSGTYPWRPISKFLQGLLYLPNETPYNVVVVHLDHISELRYHNVLSLLWPQLCFRITLSWTTSGRFSHHIFLVPTRRETRKVIWIIN